MLQVRLLWGDILQSAICEKKPERPEILGTGTRLEFDLREGPAVNGAEPAQY